jgi:hypothetical protein
MAAGDAAEEPMPGPAQGGNHAVGPFKAMAALQRANAVWDGIRESIRLLIWASQTSMPRSHVGRQ